MRIIASILLFLIQTALLAQTQEVILLLDSAKKAYEGGLVMKSVNLAGKIPLYKQGRGTKADVFLLLSKANALIGNQSESEKFYRRMLENNPVYKPTPDELPELIVASEKYFASPLFFVGFTGGLNLTASKIVNTYTVLDQDDSYTSSFQSFPSYLAGIGFGIFLNKRMNFNMNFNYNHIDINRYISFLNGIGESSLDYSISYISFIPSYTLHLFPHYVAKTSKQISPYITIAYRFQLLNSASYWGNTTFSTRSAGSAGATEEDYYTDTKLYLNNQIHGIGTNMGISIKRSRFALHTGAGFYKNLNFLNNPDTRFAVGNGDEHLYKSYVVWDDVSLTEWQLNVKINYYLNYRVFK